MKKITESLFRKDPLLEMSLDSHSPHNIIPKLITENSLLLDVGCNTGFLGKFLEKKGVISDGVDINDKALEKAKSYYKNIYKRDLYTGKLSINPKKYDFVVFSDLLEHIPRPDLLLVDTKKYLKPSGKIIASLPNVARFEIRLNILFGKFNYTNGGILGEDHLRFFTKESAIKMFNHCGYEVIESIPTGLGHRFKLFTNLSAFQFIFVCKIQS